MDIDNNCIFLECHAKINLALDVLGKRGDGYHNVELIYYEIPLCDNITVALEGEKGIRLTCDDAALPTDRDNIAYRAAEAFLSETGIDSGVRIGIHKNIPQGAGLAGGSADAAGVLKALNALTGNPLKDDELARLGAALGADVPFCLMGGCALAEGIGDILTPLPNPPRLHFVIAKPEQSISTAYVYRNLNLDNRPAELCVQAVAEGIRRGDLEMILTNAGNILESVTIPECPVISDIKKCLDENSSMLSLMSGSGTSVFGIFKTIEEAADAANALKKFTDTIFII